MITDINSEDRLVQKTFADHLHDMLGGIVSTLTTRKHLVRTERWGEATSAMSCSFAIFVLPLNA
jgi:hypothetical protein